MTKHTTANEIRELISTERAITQVTAAMDAVGLASKALEQAPSALVNEEISTATQDSIDELSEMWAALRNMNIWLKARRDGMKAGTVTV